jgi:HlyD family secretion protein
MTTKKSTLFSSKAIKLLVTVIVIAGLIGGGFFTYSRITSSQTTSTDETPLQTAKATVGDLTLYANGTGTTMPAEESNFGFNTSGQVSEIFVTIGDPVEAGQVLAQLDDAEAQIDLAEAQEAMNALTSDAARKTNPGRGAVQF